MITLQQLQEASIGINFNDVKEAQEWYVDQALKLAQVADKPFDTFTTGKMFLFYYDAKHKATLPFFDRFPLVIPLGTAAGGFLGLNLHYLPPRARVQLLSAMAKDKNNDKNDDTTTLAAVNYNHLKTYSGSYPGFQSCIKHYLSGHVVGRFQYIDPKDWNKVALLPLQSWYINPDSKYAGSPPY